MSRQPAVRVCPVPIEERIDCLDIRPARHYRPRY